MRIETIEAFEIAGFSSKNNFNNDAERTSLLWQKFIPLKMLDKLIAQENVYSISKPLNADFSFENTNSCFERIVGIKTLGGKTTTYDSFMIDGGQYGIFYHKGPAISFPKTLKSIIEILPFEGYQYDENRNRFEIVTVDYRPTDEHAIEEVWVPIKKL